MDSAKQGMYEFGEFRLDASKRRLLRGGEPIVLTPKVFETLLYLVEHRGGVLTKDELLGTLWPDVVVEENNLGQNISKLRSVLGETPGENRYIMTVPGRGYRFVAEVQAVEPPLPFPTPGEAPPAALPADTLPAGYSRQPLPDARSRNQVQRVALIVVVAGFGLGGFYTWRARPGSGVNAPPRTVAVLPFKPLLPENRDQALELGMADSLIAKLSNIRELSVRPLGAVRTYTTPAQNPVSAGRELGVEAVLDGHIQRAGDRIRVTVRLVRVDNEQQLWAGQFDEKFTDIFAVQDSISERVTRELALELTGDERERVTRRSTADFKAYELYMNGRFFVNLAQPRNAIDLFEQAVGRDPNFALAHAGLADIYSRLPIATDGPSREAIPKAKEEALKALEIDDRLAEAYTALGWISFYYEWDWAASEANHRRALQINPEDFSAHLGYAHLLSNTSRHEEALREVDRARAVDPRSPLASTLKGQFLFHARRYSEAAEQLRRTLEITPTFWVALHQRGRSYEREGRYDEALAAFKKARESGGTWTPLSLIGYTYGASGQTEEAERTLRELQSASEHAYVPPYNMALVYHGLRDTDQAMRWLERGYDERDVRMVFLGVDPLWDSVRGDPRFVALLRRMNLTR